MPAHTLARLGAVTAALVAFASLSGCGPDDGGQAAPGPRRSAASSPTGASGPASTGPSPAATDTATASSSPPQPVTLRDRLLAGADLPGFAGATGWTDGATRGQEMATPLSPCQRFAMTSIGAMRAVQREYLPEPAQTRSTAAELVAAFADPSTAARAFAVLESWHAKCDQQLADYDEHRVGDLRDVPVDGGVGHWYVLTYTKAGSASFDAEGMVRVGNRIALVSMVKAAEGSDDATKAQPVADAVRAAALRLS